MLRFLALAVLAVLIYMLVRAMIAGFLAGVRGVGGPRESARALRNELVKDPVCETYIPRRTAVVRTTGSATYYFCSPACAAKFRVSS